MPELTHFDAAGQAHMVDVGSKQETRRIADRARLDSHAAGDVRADP